MCFWVCFFCSFGLLFSGHQSYCLVFLWVLYTHFIYIKFIYINYIHIKLYIYKIMVSVYTDVHTHHICVCIYIHTPHNFYHLIILKNEIYMRYSKYKVWKHYFLTDWSYPLQHNIYQSSGFMGPSLFVRQMVDWINVFEFCPGMSGSLILHLLFLLCFVSAAVSERPALSTSYVTVPISALCPPHPIHCSS